MKKYIISLDAGTTSNRAVVFDRELSINGIAQKEFKQIFPDHGWVEHDPMEIWNTQSLVLKEVIEKTGISHDEIAAIGITNQRETTIIWERNTGTPVHNAIVWQDRRTADFCEDLKNRNLEKKIKEKTGLVIDAYFSGTKIKWILDHVEGVRARAERGELAFGTVETWLVWNLTKGRLHVTDVSNASRTMLFNINTLSWDDELLDILDIPKCLLPQVLDSSQVVGEIDESILPGAIPISGMAGDQQASLFGQLCFEKGMVKNTYGTGCFVMMNTGDKPELNNPNLLSTIAWKIGDSVSYATEGSIFVAGALIQWLRDNLKLIEKSSDIEALANEVEDSGGVVIVPAFAGLGAPHWDQFARGTVFGITRSTMPAHIARATLEAIVLQVKDAIDEMVSASGLDMKLLSVDGGASVNDTLMQIQSDLLQCEVVRPEITETTALGAALLAGLAVSFWKDEEEIRKLWKIDKSFHPTSTDGHKELIHYWKKAIERTKSWIEPK